MYTVDDELADDESSAESYLDSLLNEETPAITPQVTAEWAGAFLDAFRRFRSSQRGNEASRAAIRLGRRASADPYRFFWEFWQNADDARATELVFELEQERMLVKNNGRPFTPTEVASLLLIARSSKEGQPDLIGQHGVGSLTLMRFSDEPIYRSGYFHFRLQHSFTYPGLCLDDEPDEYVDGLQVTAPFRAEVDAAEMYRQLTQRLDSETLLYMHHLKRIEVRFGELITTAEADVTKVGAASHVTINNKTWFRFETEGLPPATALRDDGDAVTDPVHITLIRDPKSASRVPLLHAFFPTKIRHRYPWNFSAPFDVTTGREGLLESPFNRWLLGQVGRAMVSAAVNSTVGNRTEPWALVPTNADDESLLAEVWHGAVDHMKTTPWIPAGKRLLKPSEVAFPESEEIRGLLSQADLALACGENRQWVRGLPAEEVRETLVLAGALRVCCHVLSTFLSGAPKRTPEWYLRAFAAILGVLERRGNEDVATRLIDGRCLVNRLARPFSIRAVAKAGQVICNARSEVLSQELGGLFKTNLATMLHRVYRLPDTRADEGDDRLRRRVDEWLRTNAPRRGFEYESRLDAPAFIRHFVVDRNLAVEGGEVADRILGFVRDHLESYVSDRGIHRRQLTLSELGRSLRLKAHRLGPDGRKETEYRAVSDVCLPAGFREKTSWPEAARGIPNLWWADWSYRTKLVRKENPLGAARFLRELGASVGPRIEALRPNASHGTHSFFRVIRDDAGRFPNFPHEKTHFTQYSDYGLVGDSRSPDLEAWWAFTRQLPDREKARRGLALLRTFEEQWESSYERYAQASAYGYYQNGSYLLSSVPSRWLWQLQSFDWVALQGGGFSGTKGTFALTKDTKAIIDAAREKLSAWNNLSDEIAQSLGFIVSVPSQLVLTYLKETKLNSRALSVETATAYYNHLAQHPVSAPDLDAAFREGLVYSPASRWTWSRPDDCLLSNLREVFGNLVPYLDMYPEAKALWTSLRVRARPDLDFLQAFFQRVAAALEPNEASLQPVYTLADKLAITSDTLGLTASVPMAASGRWHAATEIFTTDSDELADQLQADGLWRWDGKMAYILANFFRWVGVLDVDNTATFELVPGEQRVEPSLEERIHSSMVAFAEEIRDAQPSLWPAIRGRIAAIVRGRVIVVQPLRLSVSLNHPKLGARNYEIAAKAFCREGNLYLSSLTKTSDRAVATPILEGLALAPDLRWAAINALLVHLASETTPSGGMPEEFLTEDDDQSPVRDRNQSSVTREPASRAGPQTSQQPISPKTPQATPPPPPPFPFDQYVVQSDTSGTGPAAGGGLVPRTKVTTRAPGGGHSRTSPSINPQQRSNRSTEQRGVDLVQSYLLEPSGITLSDQRLRPGVGADLVCDDGVFRELKVHSGAAPTEISLTEHEYTRAGNKGAKYELIVVEHVWESPVITVVQDPLNRLKYSPTGGVVVKGWRTVAPAPRIIRLAKPAEIGVALDGSTEHN